METRLSPEDWDYIAAQAYETYRRYAVNRNTPIWSELSEQEQRAWIEAGVRAVSVALHELLPL